MKFESDFSSVLPPPHTAKSLNNTKLRVNKWTKRGIKKTTQRVENRSFSRKLRELNISVITQQHRYSEIKKNNNNNNNKQSFGDSCSTKGGKPSVIEKAHTLVEPQT